MIEKYYHGVRVQEETELVELVTGKAGLQVVIGTAPINLAENPLAVVNIPVVCQSMQEAKSKLGYSNDFASYTLCQSMFASFNTFSVAPVVFINVLDPARHVRENEEKEYAVLNRQVRPEDLGILMHSIVVKHDTQVLTKNEDFLISFEESGKIIITLISDKTADATVLKVSSKSIDPSAVTDADIIGGYNAETGKESGLEVLRQVYPRTGMTPGLLMAPGWSHKPEIGSVMMSKCESINGVFSAECLLDLDTMQTKLYTNAPDVKEKSGYQDKHAIVLWPKAKVNDKQIYYSALYGAMTAYTDVKNDDVPSISPSNILIGVTSAVLEDGTEVFLDREQANTLNGQGIVTLINEGSWRSWGNNTSVYPEIKDVKDRWICCRRMFTWIANSLISTYRERVDSPANFRLIESICDSENIRISSYVAAGKLAGGKIEYNESENNVENLLCGKVVFRIHIAAYTPAEDILFILKFDPDLLKESLAGSTGGA